MERSRVSLFGRNIAIILLLVLTLFAAPAFSQHKDCKCIRPQADDYSSTGQVIIKSNEGKVRLVKGTVVYDQGKAAGNALIQVFKISRKEAENEDLAVSKIAEHRGRKIACKTLDDGKFCIRNLPGGYYLLLIGITNTLGINGIYFIVEVDPKGADHEIEALMSVAG